MGNDPVQLIFMVVTFLSASGIILIIYARDIIGAANKLFILLLSLVLIYIISHSVHFLFMYDSDVTILDNSCHSFLLLIIVTLTFFTWNYPKPKKMGLARTILILVPSLLLLILLWADGLINSSHAHHGMFEAHYNKKYPLYLFWYLYLIFLNIYWVYNKRKAETNPQIRAQLLLLLLGMIITNFASFIFGLFLPWVIGFYFLVEMSPLAFLGGVILFTAVAIGKYNMFPTALDKVNSFTIKRKMFFSALIIVPIIILIIQIPLGRLIFNIHTNADLTRYFLISLFAGIIVSVSITFIIMQVTSNPLNKLKERVTEIEKGNYGIKLETKTNDEIGELTEAFNNMSETLKNNTEELVKREKLAALGKMAAVLAHEIKTPLTSIKLNADIIAETLDLSDDDRENFEIMKTEINRLNNLVKDVLQFSRQMELNFSEVNLKELIDNVYNQLCKKLEEKNISLINSAENVLLNVDADRLRQVFINLIDNSIEACLPDRRAINEHGLIEISSQIHKQENSISIFIKDKGNGIEPGLKIFEPFFTTKSSGTGLGLSISQKIIEQHEGDLNLLSSKKGETIFEAKLPMVHKHKKDKITLIKDRS